MHSLASWTTLQANTIILNESKSQKGGTYFLKPTGQLTLPIIVIRRNKRYARTTKLHRTRIYDLDDLNQNTSQN